MGSLDFRNYKYFSNVLLFSSLAVFAFYCVLSPKEKREFPKRNMASVDSGCASLFNHEAVADSRSSGNPYRVSIKDSPLSTLENSRSDVIFLPIPESHADNAILNRVLREVDLSKLSVDENRGIYLKSSDGRVRARIQFADYFSRKLSEVIFWSPKGAKRVFFKPKDTAKVQAYYDTKKSGIFGFRKTTRELSLVELRVSKDDFDLVIQAEDGKFFNLSNLANYPVGKNNEEYNLWERFHSLVRTRSWIRNSELFPLPESSRNSPGPLEPRIYLVDLVDKELKELEGPYRREAVEYHVNTWAAKEKRVAWVSAGKFGISFFEPADKVLSLAQELGLPLRVIVSENPKKARDLEHISSSTLIDANSVSQIVLDLYGKRVGLADFEFYLQEVCKGDVRTAFEHFEQGKITTLEQVIELSSDDPSFKALSMSASQEETPAAGSATGASNSVSNPAVLARMAGGVTQASALKENPAVAPVAKTGSAQVSHEAVATLAASVQDVTVQQQAIQRIILSMSGAKEAADFASAREKASTLGGEVDKLLGSINSLPIYQISTGALALTLKTSKGEEIAAGELMARLAGELAQIMPTNSSETMAETIFRWLGVKKARDWLTTIQSVEKTIKEINGKMAESKRRLDQQILHIQQSQHEFMQLGNVLSSTQEQLGAAKMALSKVQTKMAAKKKSKKGADDLVLIRDEATLRNQISVLTSRIVSIQGQMSDIKTTFVELLQAEATAREVSNAMAITGQQALTQLLCATAVLSAVQRNMNVIEKLRRVNATMADLRRGTAEKVLEQAGVPLELAEVLNNVTSFQDAARTTAESINKFHENQKAALQNADEAITKLGEIRVIDIQAVPLPSSQEVGTPALPDSAGIKIPQTEVEKVDLPAIKP